jgi:ubiquinol-cytochrome c reductase iron-sulfur subunit
VGRRAGHPGAGDPSHRDAHMRSRPELPVAVALLCTILAGLGLAVVYWLGGQPQIEGALLAVALGSLGAALILWERRLMTQEEVEEQRELASPAEERAAAQAALERGGQEIGRRRFLARLLGAAAAALGLAALFPIRSLGRAPGLSLFRTAWRPGTLAVDESGVPVGAEQISVGSVLTVFPQGNPGSPDGQALLIRVEEGALRLPADRLAGAPEGLVAYSKVCTHAGCPVGLYRAETHELLCPCHQSTFDVLTGARPTFGPASRALPQLPIEIGTDGLIRARGDFTEPVGPGFWEL